MFQAVFLWHFSLAGRGLFLVPVDLLYAADTGASFFSMGLSVFFYGFHV